MAEQPTGTGRLSDLAAAGSAVPCAGNLPLEINDPGRAWFVERGAVEVFLLEHSGGVEIEAPQHALHAGQGRLLFGVEPRLENDLTLGLVAKGLPGTILRELDSAALAALDPAEFADQADAWLIDMATLLARDVKPAPRADLQLDAGRTVEGKGLLAARRGVVWAVDLPQGAASFMGLADLPDSVHLAPVSASAWLTLMKETSVTGESSKTLAERGELLSAMRDFHGVALALELLNRKLAIIDLVNLDRAKLGGRRADEENARRRLFELHGERKEAADEAGAADLFAALGEIGRCEGIEFKFPDLKEDAGVTQSIDTVMDLSGIRSRRVTLAAQERWWRVPGRSILAFRADDGRPVALLPGRFGGYRALDPISGRKTRVGAGYAETLSPEAWIFYSPLPPRSADFRDLLRIGGVGNSGDLMRFLLAGLLVGLATLLPAVLAGVILNRALPGGDAGLLYAAAGALVAAAVLQALLQLVQGMALMRLEGRVISRMEAAFWDRLLRLPLVFLQRYPAGDTSMRGMLFRVLRDHVLGAVAVAVVSVVFVLPIFALIFRYQNDSAMSVGGFAIGGITLTTLIGLRQIAPQFRVFAMMRKLSGLLLQFVRGIPRFRTGNAEGSAYAIWARNYRRQKQAEIEIGNSGAHLQAWQVAVVALPGVVLMMAAPLSGDERVTAGAFIVVYLLFSAFMSAYGRMSAVFGQISTVKPSLDMIRPFLAEPPEMVATGQPVEELGGLVSIDHVSFRYDPDGPLILDDISMEFHPGEFVAIAGESGAGKSTIFNLLLGLDLPDAGNVYYDGRDLHYLNLRQLRRQIGVVPQDSRLFPQDIWDNIVGDDRDVEVADVRRAIERADIADEIDAMPMGAFTFVGAGALSGGESQRVRIARALLRNPRVILLDEATNALGNDSQARVMSNLARLPSTRIVIAHRLSTLREADRIYVLKEGKVCQEGAFDELNTTDGLFRDLMRRQIT